MRRLSAIALWLKSAGVTHKNDPSARQHKYPNSLAFAPIFHGVVAVWKAGGLLAILLLAVTLPVKADDGRFDGTVIFLRHALAPGNGDPANFNLKDCQTQRNLDETGRMQARGIGKRIAAANLDLAGVYSSEWCRCLETALLLDLGPVTPFSGLNSFYENHAPRDATLAKLQAKLDSLPRDGAPVIMVTHYVTIQAITNIAVPSGGAVLFDLATGYARELSLLAFSPAN
jgi:phosphohistidine phosphatase SixA